MRVPFDAAGRKIPVGDAQDASDVDEHASTTLGLFAITMEVLDVGAALEEFAIDG